MTFTSLLSCANVAPDLSARSKSKVFGITKGVGRDGGISRLPSSSWLEARHMTQTLGSGEFSMSLWVCEALAN